MSESNIPYGYIYKILFPNGKVYIGITHTSLKQRRNEHKSLAKNGSSRYVYNALRKYDMVDTFELIEIDHADTKEELFEKEIGYITMYNSFDRKYGYNGTIGGDGINGYIFTEENRKKMSEAQKKRVINNPDTYKKQGDTLRKYYEKHPEVGKLHSERMKTHYEEHPEARERLREISIKQFENPEARQKMSEAKIKYFVEHPEAGKLHSERIKKHYENPEARQKMSEAINNYYKEHPEARQKCSEAQKKRFEKPGAREKTSEAQKKRFEKPGAIQHILNKRGKNQPFDVFTKDGTFVKTFTYQMEAREYLQKEHNITSTIKISEVLTGVRNKSAGFTFKYK